MIEVPKEFKIKVLKKTILHIEKSAKNLKPGSHIYTQKLLGFSMKPAIKSKFYDILKNESMDLNTLDSNLILLMGGELLNSNKENNINPDVFLSRDFNENYFDSQINSEIKEIFVIYLFIFLFLRISSAIT